MQTFELISNDLCPYTQRAAIQLAEKGAPFTRVYIDLADKPEWLSRLSPLGKVPLLRVGDAAIFETVVICEYLEDVAPGRPLHPADPLDRARHRAWIELSSAIIADVFGFYTAPDGAAFDRKRNDLRGKLCLLDGNLEARPYFAGSEFHLVDAAFAPVFRLFETLDRAGDFRFFEGLENVEAYRAALAGRESVQQAVVPDYAQRFERYLRARGSHLARAMAEAEVV
jgi:glutathione S-transferase